MKEVEKVVKPSKDVKADVESSLELESEIKLWLDKEGSQEDCTQEVLLQYPGSYSKLYPESRQTVFTDVLNRSWDTVEKQSREMSKYDYVFPGWWEFLQTTTSSSRSIKPTYDSGDSSHYRQFARAVNTGVYSFYASLSIYGGLSYNGAMQVLL